MFDPGDPGRVNALFLQNENRSGSLDSVIDSFNPLGEGSPSVNEFGQQLHGVDATCRQISEGFSSFRSSRESS